ncbi:MAG: DUF61 family protein [Methanomicrobiales archaeon]|nr:DUF61 family protein [Methanomicrobiales archaeon]MDD1660120.1 DUF61 family protein [Methanomicrobiales archaeon]
MDRRPCITDESVFSRWMSLEMGRINQGIVERRKTLAELLREDSPSSVTKEGKEYRFHREVLQQLGEKLPGSLHRRLRLPILFHFDPDVKDSCLLTDPAAVEALKVLGEIGSLRQLRDGKLWVGRAIVYSLIRKYPTVVQMAMG